MNDRLASHKTVLVEHTKFLLHRLGYPVEEQIRVAEALGERFTEVAEVKG